MYFANHKCALQVNQDVGVGADAHCPDWHHKTAYVFYAPTAVGTVQIQISPDGVNFYNKGEALTATGFVDIPEACTHVRTNTTVDITVAAVSAVLVGY